MEDSSTKLQLMPLAYAGARALDGRGRSDGCAPDEKLRKLADVTDMNETVGRYK